MGSLQDFLSFEVQPCAPTAHNVFYFFLPKEPFFPHIVLLLNAEGRAPSSSKLTFSGQKWCANL